MSFFLIDPSTQSVTIIDKPKFYEYSKIIGCSIVSGTMTKVGKQEWSLYYDDEGLFKLKCECNDKVTLIPGIDPIPGKIIICKTDKNGNSVGLKITIDEIKASIKFVGGVSLYF